MNFSFWFGVNLFMISLIGTNLLAAENKLTKEEYIAEALLGSYISGENLVILERKSDKYCGFKLILNPGKHTITHDIDSEDLFKQINKNIPDFDRNIKVQFLHRDNSNKLMRHTVVFNSDPDKNGDLLVSINYAVEYYLEVEINFLKSLSGFNDLIFGTR